MKRNHLTVIAFAMVLCSCGSESSESTSGTQPADNAATAGALATTDKQEPDLRSRPEYKLDDFDWSWAPESERYKRKILVGINRLVHENERCATIDADSPILPAQGYSAKAHPVFQVVCQTAEGKPFGATVNLTLVQGPKGSFAAAPTIDQARATEACENAARSDAAHPQTASFSWIADADFRTFPNGKARLSSSFTAENSLGVRRKFLINCFFEGKALTEHNVHEAEG